ncbi:helix-turn-helix domain-containing protein [Proteus mirabilis]|uniref:helix-turn-helix domain-containing protein n=1 Tax=Proteus mirabilis TaxID=584 RepID=UPI002AC310BD|nr:helix-turn-helix transcriptional regulator [Proteus mirabilis]
MLFSCKNIIKTIGYFILVFLKPYVGIFMDINKILGREIKFLRKRSLLSGCELAKAFGISQQHLSRIERGEVQWSVSFLLRVCAFF